MALLTGREGGGGTVYSAGLHHLLVVGRWGQGQGRREEGRGNLCNLSCTCTDVVCAFRELSDLSGSSGDGQTSGFVRVHR